MKTDDLIRVYLYSACRDLEGTALHLQPAQLHGEEFEALHQEAVDYFETKAREILTPQEREGMCTPTNQAAYPLPIEHIVAQRLQSILLADNPGPA